MASHSVAQRNVCSCRSKYIHPNDINTVSQCLNCTPKNVIFPDFPTIDVMLVEDVLGKLKPSYSAGLVDIPASVPNVPHLEEIQLAF